LKDIQKTHRKICTEKSELEQLSKNVLRKSYQEKLAAQSEVDQQKLTIKKIEAESQRKDWAIMDLKKQLKTFALDSTGTALDVLREAVAEKNLGPEELEVFQTLSQIVFPDAFQEPNSSMTNFMNDELYVHIEEKKVLAEQLKEKEEILNTKNKEIEIVAQERTELVKRLAELQAEQKEMHAAILADVEQKRDEALINCQKKQNLIYSLIALLLALFMFIVLKN
jgi:hypothetical protein